MFSINGMKRFAVAMALAGIFATTTWAQSPITASAQSVTLNATEPEAISVTLGGVSQVNFDLSSTQAAGDNTVSWTTNWNLNYTDHPTVVSCVYFSSSNALTGGAYSQNIPSSSVLGQPGATGSFSTIDGTACGESNALQISSTSITSSNYNNGSNADSVNLKIDQTSLGLAPDTYTGTLYIVSIADVAL